jgi:hypothetical protein
MFNGRKPLNMTEPGNRIFRFRLRFRLIFGQDGQ